MQSRTERRRPRSPVNRPGLFITATDTEVGKTVVTCAIAAALRRQGVRVAVCKPVATGCRREREGLVSDDAEALAHFADCRLPLDVINPVRYREPLAPAVAAERKKEPIDWQAIDDSLRRLAADHDVVLVEGVGGLLTPLDNRRTVLDLAKHLRLPTVVVTRPVLGTLNHTAMTCRLLRNARLRLAGLVLNRYDPDTRDLAEATNPRWLSKQNSARILATLPETPGVAPEQAKLPETVIEAAATADWRSVMRRP